MKFLSVASITCCLFLTACVTTPTVQTQINSLVVAQRLDQAEDFFVKQEQSYGDKNSLLYWLDYGMVLHLKGDYQQSAYVFNRAKKEFDKLYTESISDILSTWLVNDYWAPYRGEDHEYLWVNIIQALNYAAMGDIHEALVEARDLDFRLRMIQSHYADERMHVLKDNAFARMLMGILYEALGTEEGYNDAHITYSKAMSLYDELYASQYDVNLPRILEENFHAVDQWMQGDSSLIEEKAKKAHVYVFHYLGFAPLKVPQAIPVPVDKEFVIKITFPKYIKRHYAAKGAVLKAMQQGTLVNKQESVLGENIGAIALKHYDLRRPLMYAKAIARPAMKYAMEEKLQDYTNEKHGKTAGRAVTIMGNVFNLYSERADVRSWKTLPDQIHVSHLILEPGVYQLEVDLYDEFGNILETKDLGKQHLSTGDYKFFVHRSYH